MLLLFVNIYPGAHFFLYSNMVKPLKESIFRPMDGFWKDADGNMLADVLAEYEMVIDDRCEFLRLRDYDRQISIWYRASAMKVKITIWDDSER